jgi:hypothetical protein
MHPTQQSLYVELRGRDLYWPGRPTMRSRKTFGDCHKAGSHGAGRCMYVTLGYTRESGTREFEADRICARYSCAQIDRYLDEARTREMDEVKHAGRAVWVGCHMMQETFAQRLAGNSPTSTALNNVGCSQPLTQKDLERVAAEGRIMAGLLVYCVDWEARVRSAESKAPRVHDVCSSIQLSQARRIADGLS